ncbi:MAG: DUF1622 domain-containing protein [Gemmatimonadales bacterium]|nr:DUF1622 domain-containing protein [Gemmatimonadales bacterium]
MTMSAYEAAEHWIFAAVQWLRLVVEATGALVIAIGLATAVLTFVSSVPQGQSAGYVRVRLVLARYLAVGLEFQLGADILSTAVAPSWDQIGKLGAIAVIRTGLNFFLAREMENEARQVDAPA